MQEVFITISGKSVASSKELFLNIVHIEGPPMEMGKKVMMCFGQAGYPTSHVQNGARAKVWLQGGHVHLIWHFLTVEP